MRIFFVAPGILEVPTNRGGGIEHNIFQIAKRASISSIIFSPRPRESYPLVKNKKYVVKHSLTPATKVYPLPPHIRVSSFISFLLTFIFNLEAAIQIILHSKKIDVVVVFDKFWGFLPFTAAVLTQKKRVYMEYNIWPWTYNKSHRTTIFALQMGFGVAICKMSSLVIANSPSIIEGMISGGIVSTKIYMVPTGINFQLLSRYESQRNPLKPIKILYIGRLVEERGADLLFEIIIHSLKMNQDIKFGIIGGGPLYEHLHEFITRFNLSTNVQLLNQIPHPEAIAQILDADVVLFISKNENFGSLALLESMAMGQPVIATDVGSTSRIVIHKKSGFLVKPDVVSISNAIEDAISDRKQLIEMGIESRRIASDYDWNVIATKFLSVLLNGL